MSVHHGACVALVCDAAAAHHPAVAPVAWGFAFRLSRKAHFELAPNQAKWDAQVQADKEVEGARGFDSLQRFLHSAERPPMPDA